METPVKHLFPRIPERDEQGNACLYPGFPKYEGVAATYSTPHGELIVMAPNAEALNEQVRRFDIGGEIDRTKCRVVTMERLSANPKLTDAKRSV